jgi:hypothetical protein
VWTPTDRGEIFIAVECRDRGAVQDVTWIEQLIAKKESIGADLLIAVTSSRFTLPAVVKAAKRGVLVRTLTTALADEIVSWTLEAYIEIRAYRVEISDVMFDTRIGKVVGTSTTRLFNVATQSEEALDRFVSRMIAPTLPRTSPKIPNHGDSHPIRLSGKPEKLEVLLPFRARIQSFVFDAVIRRHVEMMPVASGFSYDDVAVASRLVEGYRFDGNYGVAGDVLIDLESQQGRLILDFSNFNGWIEQTILKAGRPIALMSCVIVQGS